MTETEEEKIKLLIASLTARAAQHGVQLVAGESILVTVEKLIKRLDEYRDLPQNKGRLIVE